MLKRPMLLLMRVFEGSGLKVRNLTAKLSVMTFDAEAHSTRLRDVAGAHPIDSIGQLLELDLAVPIIPNHQHLNSASQFSMTSCSKRD